MYTGDEGLSTDPDQIIHVVCKQLEVIYKMYVRRYGILCTSHMYLLIRYSKTSMSTLYRCCHNCNRPIQFIPVHKVNSVLHCALYSHSYFKWSVIIYHICNVQQTQFIHQRSTKHGTFRSFLVPSLSLTSSQMMP